MPWNPGVYDAVCAGLRKAAADGDFVPYIWAERIETTDDGGCRFFGCGWGLVGWFAAVYKDGAGLAKKMLPVGCAQPSVNAVLLSVGVTDEEIARMTPALVWSKFDKELAIAYQNRDWDWNAFIKKSMQLAEYFIAVLNRVEVGSDDMMYLPFVPPASATWQPSLFGPELDDNVLVLAPEDLVLEMDDYDVLDQVA